MRQSARHLRRDGRGAGQIGADSLSFKCQNYESNGGLRSAVFFVKIIRLTLQKVLDNQKLQIWRDLDMAGGFYLYLAKE